jgi:dienelactone hydrolase
MERMNPAMSAASESPIRKERIDNIPTIWIEPDPRGAQGKLAVWLPWFTGSKESTEPQLRQLAAKGFTALSYDPWQHGERARESAEDLEIRVFGNFRRYMWPILGQTMLDALRVIDWAMANCNVGPAVYAGGISMGGDIAVATAGIDPRIICVATIGSTPDWLRAGSEIAPGEPDAYAQFFYDRFNPLTHLEAYRLRPAIAFECGAEDRHVPPQGALRFRDALGAASGADPDRVRVNLHPGAGHTTTEPMWRNALEWLAGH